jgi:SAM-dependent methyltransferase
MAIKDIARRMRGLWDWLYLIYWRYFMPDCYDAIAETYDLMIDWPTRLAREQPFFSAIFPTWDGINVLDIGCGTGHHCAHFASLGATVLGIDPSNAMLARARAIFTRDNPRFVTGKFNDLPTIAGNFDLITVLGNTLAYASDEDEMATILRAIRNKLTPTGLLCVQLVNYDSLAIATSRWLTPIHRVTKEEEYLFLREYRRISSRVEFTMITLRHSLRWEQQTERSLHLPISEEMLHNGLRDAGFTSISIYGDYKFATFNPSNSPALIAVAH